MAVAGAFTQAKTSTNNFSVIPQKIAKVNSLAPTLYWKANRTWRLIAVAVLIIAALIWALTGYLSYWNHLESFQKWVPAPMR